MPQTSLLPRHFGVRSANGLEARSRKRVRVLASSKPSSSGSSSVAREKWAHEFGCAVSDGIEQWTSALYGLSTGRSCSFVPDSATHLARRRLRRVHAPGLSVARSRIERATSAHDAIVTLDGAALARLVWLGARFGPVTGPSRHIRQRTCGPWCPTTQFTIVDRELRCRAPRSTIPLAYASSDAVIVTELSARQQVRAQRLGRW